MKINIITPCSRPQNLKLIAQSIKKSLYNYKWIVIFDSCSIPDIEIPKEICTIDIYQENNSVFGNAQRNYALKYIDTNSWVYFNDDDTIIPENFQNVIDKYSDIDFISFPQMDKNNNLRLRGDTIKPGQIDMHSFIFRSELIQHSTFVVDRRDADGIFAEEIYHKAKNHLYTKEIFSVYNAIR